MDRVGTTVRPLYHKENVTRCLKRTQLGCFVQKEKSFKNTFPGQLKKTLNIRITLPVRSGDIRCMKIKKFIVGRQKITLLDGIIRCPFCRIQRGIILRFNLIGTLYDLIPGIRRHTKRKIPVRIVGT